MDEVVPVGQNTRHVIANLVAFIAGAAVFSWWMLARTDWFPVVAGLLGLGGVFAWFAFLGNLISSERKAEFQKLFDEKILQCSGVWIALIGLFLILIIAGSFFGTLEVDNLATARGRVIEVREIQNGAPETNDVERFALAPRSNAKVLLGTIIFSSSEYQVKTPDLPATRVRVESFQVAKVIVPDTFIETPVILARPQAAEVGTLAQSKFRLQVFVNEKKIAEKSDYRGQAVWVGAGESVKIPDRLLDQWRFEFISNGLNSAEVSRWRTPISMAPQYIFPPGANVTLKVLRADGFVLYHGSTVIPKSGKATKFPDEVVLRGE